MFLSFRKTLCRLGSFRFGAGIRVKGISAVFLVFIFACLNLFWYMMLGVMWMIYGIFWLYWKMIYGTFWLCWKMILWVYIKPIIWLFSKLFGLLNTRSASERKSGNVSVLVTKDGKKYHFDRNCPYVRGCSAKRMKLSKAKKMGYSPCHHCATITYRD